MALAAQGAPGPLFLPHLDGERAPFWNPALRGAWLGLGLDTGPADLALSVLAGVAFQGRLVLERAEAALGWRADSLALGGGGAAWAQVRADVLGRTMRVGVDEPGLVGAGLAAWRALGHAVVEASAAGPAFMPRAGWDGLFERWSAARGIPMRSAESP